MEMKYENNPEDFKQEEPEPIVYPEKMLSKRQDEEQNAHLDFSYAGLKVDVENLYLLDNDAFAKARRYGLGTSDSSVVLGVSPFKTRKELIAEKARDTLTEEEKAIGNLVAVRKGVDLEPLIISKFTKFFNQMTWKPTDMYRSMQYPYLAYNFDGITGQPGAYIPAEIKVATAPGAKHYNPMKAIFNEIDGFKPPQVDITRNNVSINTKAEHYGMPAYYYTQLQQEIMGAGSDFGYLSVLFETTWQFYTFFAHRDEKVINALIVEGYKVWQEILKLNPERGNIL